MHNRNANGLDEWARIEAKLEAFQVTVNRQALRIEHLASQLEEAEATIRRCRDEIAINHAIFTQARDDYRRDLRGVTSLFKQMSGKIARLESGATGDPSKYENAGPDWKPMFPTKEMKL